MQHIAPLTSFNFGSCDGAKPHHVTESHNISSPLQQKLCERGVTEMLTSSIHESDQSTALQSQLSLTVQCWKSDSWI